jgi:hypothetical protein
MLLSSRESSVKSVGIGAIIAPLLFLRRYFINDGRFRPRLPLLVHTGRGLIL